jgi:acyl-CoA synthetase (AMP-forming)/AMP-acid ligase II
MNQFLQLSKNLATQLQDVGCDKNTIVGIMSENRLEYPIVIMGTMLTGAPITCYNPAVTVGEYLILLYSYVSRDAKESVTSKRI